MAPLGAAVMQESLSTICAARRGGFSLLTNPVSYQGIASAMP
jgi:hypothetical protein